MYNSVWRRELTSSNLCGALDGHCPGSVFDKGATLCRRSVLLSCVWPALLLILVFSF